MGELPQQFEPIDQNIAYWLVCYAIQWAPLLVSLPREPRPRGLLERVYFELLVLPF